MKNTMEYKGYKGSVEYSAEDGCLHGKVLGLSHKALIIYEGISIDELKSDFEAGVDSYLDGCAEMGVEPAKPYSGSLNVRIPSELHSQIAELARKTGTTINALIKRALDDFTKHAL